MRNLLTIVLFLISVTVLSQNVVLSESESTADASALLDVQSSSKGVLIPRLTELQRTSITDPANGLLVYQTDASDGFYFYDGAAWLHLIDNESISDSGSGSVITSGERERLQQASPAGSVTAFAGPIVPNGWLLCDGSEISKTTYPDLFDAIGTFWGAGSTTDLFKLPNLQGRFLRGVDNGEGNDPDAVDRTDEAGVNTLGDVVGSYQEDAFQGHYHRALSPANSFVGGGQTGLIVSGPNFGNSPSTGSPITDGENGDPRTTSETRPKNASVNYIIKY